MKIEVKKEDFENLDFDVKINVSHEHTCSCDICKIKKDRVSMIFRWVNEDKITPMQAYLLIQAIYTV